MAILFEAHASSAESYAFAVGGGTYVVEGLPALNRALLEWPDETLVVIGPDIDLELALDFSAAQRLERPGLGVVLLRRRVDVTVLGQAIRAGVREVVVADDHAALADACRRSAEVSLRFLSSGSEPEPGPRGTVVTVFAAKGGCGKTTIATNLALALAEGGKRRVCLLDLDLSFGDVAISMHLTPSKTLADAVAMADHMDQQGVASLITPHSRGLDTVLAPVEPRDGETIPVGLVSTLLTLLRRSYDVIVVDTPPAFTEHVLAAFDVSDLYVLPTTLDIPALKNLKLTLDTLDMLGYPRSGWRLVLNRADAKVGLTRADVERTLKAAIAAEIPSSRAVPASTNKGIPLVVDEPGHAVSKAIRALAAGMVPAGPAQSRREARRMARRVPMLRRGA